MSGWKLISDEIPAEKEVVLLAWPVPDSAPTYRLGCLLFKTLSGDMPIWKFEIDYGDACAWVYSNRGDDQPSHWMQIPSLT